ncbi:MAG TPA: toluene-4-monooxygenase system B family protein, partial [Polyangiaceae bacterium]|nr:toluene-4-monooxygenase system B family protein [Polyangiaceae bacterium]
MLVPLHGFVRGDTVGLLVLVHDTDTIEQVAQTLMAAASVRLAPAPRARVYRGQEELPAEQT